MLAPVCQNCDSGLPKTFLLPTEATVFRRCCVRFLSYKTCLKRHLYVGTSITAEGEGQIDA